MPKPPPWWFDPATATTPFLTALAEVRHLSTRANYTMPVAKERGSVALIEAIRNAIDDYAECEFGHRQFFWEKPHSAGCKHS